MKQKGQVVCLLSYEVLPRRWCQLQEKMVPVAGMGLKQKDSFLVQMYSEPLPCSGTVLGLELQQ